MKRKFVPRNLRASLAGRRRSRKSFITYKYRSSLNIRRKLTSFYSPLSLSRLWRNTRSSGLQYKLNYLDTRTDIILYKAQWARSISQAQFLLKHFLPVPPYLKPGDVIDISPAHSLLCFNSRPLLRSTDPRGELIKIIYKNKLAHLKKGNSVPNHLIVSPFKIIFNPVI